MADLGYRSLYQAALAPIKPILYQSWLQAYRAADAELVASV